MGTNETTVRANPHGHSEVRHFSPVRLVDTDFSGRQGNRPRANPVISPTERALFPGDPLGYRLQNALCTIGHDPLYVPIRTMGRPSLMP